MFTADVRVQVPPRPPEIKGHLFGCPFIFICIGDWLHFYDPIGKERSSVILEDKESPAVENFRKKC